MPALTDAIAPSIDQVWKSARHPLPSKYTSCRDVLPKPCTRSKGPAAATARSHARSNHQTLNQRAGRSGFEMRCTAIL
jgi:hypothetical protein